MTMNGDELDLRRETIFGGGAEVILAWSMPLVPRWSRDRHGISNIQQCEFQERTSHSDGDSDSPNCESAKACDGNDTDTLLE